MGRFRPSKGIGDDTQLGDGFSKKQVTAFFDILSDIAHKELKDSGEFTLPG